MDQEADNESQTKRSLEYLHLGAIVRQWEFEPSWPKLAPDVLIGAFSLQTVEFRCKTLFRCKAHRDEQRNLERKTLSANQLRLLIISLLKKARVSQKKAPAAQPSDGVVPLPGFYRKWLAI